PPSRGPVLPPWRRGTRRSSDRLQLPAALGGCLAPAQQLPELGHVVCLPVAQMSAPESVERLPLLGVAGVVAHSHGPSAIADLTSALFASALERRVAASDHRLDGG